MLNFAQLAMSVADAAHPGDTTLSGNNVTLGSVDSPQVTVVSGDLELSGSGSGAGMLVVTGSLSYEGAFDYHGLIMVVGEGRLEFGGANKSIFGGVYVAKIEDPEGTPTFGEPVVSLRGRTNIYYNSQLMEMANSLLPLSTVSWREITPDIEPTP